MDDYKIRAFRAIPSSATKELLSKSTQNCPVIDLSGPCQSSSDKEVPVQNETSRKERRDSWPSLDRTVPPQRHSSPIPIRRSLPPTRSNHKSSPVCLPGLSPQSDALTPNTPVDVNGLVCAFSPQTDLDVLNSTNGPVESSAAEPSKTPSSDGHTLDLDNNIIQPTSCAQSISDPSPNGLVHNSGAMLNSSLGLLPSSPLDRPIQNFTEAAIHGKLNLPTTEVVLQPSRRAQSPSKTGPAQCPKLSSQNMDLGLSQNDLCERSQHPWAHPGTQTTAPKKNHSCKLTQ